MRITPLSAGTILTLAGLISAGLHRAQQEREPRVVSTTVAAKAKDFVKIASEVKLEARTAREEPGLYNVFTLSERIVSGSEPHGDEAFAALAKMGIKTIISVDSKAPAVDLAARHGMRYVHLPIGYHGVKSRDVLRLVKTYREASGPFFVHCFHGAHRGPAAAAVGRVALDGVARETAVGEMRQWCGTAPTYSGLYASVGTFEIPSVEQTRALDWPLPERAPIDDYTDVMVAVSRSDDALKHLAQFDYAGDPGHPDLDAVNEATKLHESFVRSLEVDEVAKKPADFRRWTLDSIDLSEKLLATLKGVKAGERSKAADAKDLYKKIAATCVACHEAYRNHAPVSRD